MNPLETIRQKIEQSRQREMGVQDGPWKVKDSDLIAGDRFIVGVRQYNHVAGVSEWPIAIKNKEFIAHARTDLPLFRDIAALAVDALEKCTDALRRCYDVTDFPANGDSTQDHALADAASALNQIAARISK